jgi:predicted dienelactone hydrolase
VTTGAVRDAEPRPLDVALPVVLFSHGWGGFRSQSITYTEHLASRGYVVVSADHPGRHLADVLPCVFSPPLDGCDPVLDDPAPEDLEDVLDWLADAHVDPGGFLEGLVDLDRLGLSGHSAGGGTTADMGDPDPRFKALLPMAAPVTVTRVDAAVLALNGSCDPFADNAATAESRVQGQLLQLQDAGHMAFSDLCRMDVVGLAETYLAGRDDLNDLWYTQLVDLASNGCPGIEPPVQSDCGDTFMDLDRSDVILITASTLFFDQVLAGTGPGVTEGLFDDAALVP